jgi:hypothetical protein
MIHEPKARYSVAGVCDPGRAEGSQERGIYAAPGVTDPGYRKQLSPEAR